MMNNYNNLGRGFCRPAVIMGDNGPINPNLLTANASKMISTFTTIFGGTTEQITTNLHNGLSFVLKINGGTSGGNGGVQSLLSAHKPSWLFPAGNYTFQTWYYAEPDVDFRITTFDGVKYLTGSGKWDVLKEPKTTSSGVELHEIINVEDNKSILLGGIKFERGLIGTKYVEGVQ